MSDIDIRSPLAEPLNEDPVTYIALDILPVEILLHIFQYLDANFLSTSVSNVCKRFSELLDDETSWKVRMHIKWSSKYLIPPGTKIDWREACVQREQQYELWSNRENNTKLSILPTVHIAIIDCFYKLPNQHLVSASRDRSFCIWDVNNIDAGEGVLVHHAVDAHEGWIWCVDGDNELLFTGSWDQTIKTWDINTLSWSQTFNFKAPIICLTHEGSTLYAGSFDGIRSLDLRRPFDPIHVSRYHSRATIGITMLDEKYLVSISEDKTLVVSDIRTKKKVKSCKFDPFPTSIFNGGGHLWVGDKGGSMYMLDAKNFETVKVWHNVHKKNITALEHSLGVITTVSTDRTICILEPTEEVKVVTRMKTEEELTGFAKLGNKLISSMTGLDVAIWYPKE